MRIAVTGEERELPELEWTDGTPLEWVNLPVLNFERLPVAKEFMEMAVERPYDWVIFTSQRAVHFWSETLLEHEIDFPIKTQVACIGESTANVATNDGFNPDFYPTEPGSEVFLEEFKDLLSNNADRPRILMPMAEQGRLFLAQGLRELGCAVDVIPLYRTTPKSKVDTAVLGNVDAIVLTSPSSFDALQSVCDLKNRKLIAQGSFTAEHLAKKGFSASKLPAGELANLLEVL